MSEEIEKHVLWMIDQKIVTKEKPDLPASMANFKWGKELQELLNVKLAEQNDKND